MGQKIYEMDFYCFEILLSEIKGIIFHITMIKSISSG